MKRFDIALTIAVLASLSSCATITRGTTEAFVVETEPGGATARTSLGFMCEPTPCVIPNIKRNASFTVTIEKDGYKPATYSITNKRADGGGLAMAGNVLVGGIIGGVVDANNGAMQNLVPNPLIVTLEPIDEE